MNRLKKTDESLSVFFFVQNLAEDKVFDIIVCVRTNTQNVELEGIHMNEERLDKKAVFRCAGGFVAWVIGSGFATGQEVLQFFTSYGFASYFIILINLAGFLVVGKVLLTTGYRNREDEGFQQFQYYCGNKMGAFYSWLIPITLLPVMSVLISGAGATLSEYYGLNHYVGALIMAVAILIAYFIGFNRLVSVLSFVGPSIIAFCLMIGLITVVKDYGNFDQIRSFEPALAESQSAAHWLVSAILYVSYNFLCGSVYYTQLGKTTGSMKEAKTGAILGAVLLITAITVINTAILLNGGETAALAIPNLYLAKKISWVFGAVFSVFLVMGIFSACSAMMWTVCSKFATGKEKTNRIIAFAVAGGTFLLGLFSFGELIGVIYPIIGYLGLIYIFCVLKKKSV